MKRTKIICTLGPSTDKPGILEEMMNKGMNVARLNFSHGSHEEHKKRIDTVKQLREKLDIPVAILLDTKGPEIRIGCFANHSITLNKGDKFTLTTDDEIGDEKRVSISCKTLNKVLKPKDNVLIDDGLVGLVVDFVDGNDIVCTVKNGGKLSDRKSVNLPNIVIDMPYMTDVDKKDILFGIENDVDYVAASFVRNEADILEIRKFLNDNGGERIKLIAKIENKSGVENTLKILNVADGLMVARGDMGVEIQFELLPEIQKMLIKSCLTHGKIAITATQMLDSMIKNPRPTRAEVSDVANAIYDGTSAIMLSGETAAGMYPIESLEAMVKIALTTESRIHYNRRFKNMDLKNNTITDAVCHAACTTAIDLDAKIIAAVTKTGHTARMVSKYHADYDILGMALDRKTYYQLALTWGVLPMMNKRYDSTDKLFDSTVKTAKEIGMIKEGEIIVIVGGAPNSQSISDMLKAQVV